MNPRLFRVQRGEIWVHYCTAQELDTKVLPLILQLISGLFAPAPRPAGFDPPETKDHKSESDATRPPPHDPGLCTGHSRASP